MSVSPRVCSHNCSNCCRDGKIAPFFPPRVTVFHIFLETVKELGTILLLFFQENHGNTVFDIHYKHLTHNKFFIFDAHQAPRPLEGAVVQ